jgi:hypothetical protein
MEYSEDRMNDSLQIEKRFSDFLANTSAKISKMEIKMGSKKWGTEEFTLQDRLVPTLVTHADS